MKGGGGIGETGGGDTIITKSKKNEKKKMSVIVIREIYDCDNPQEKFESELENGLTNMSVILHSHSLFITNYHESIIL